MRMKDPPHPGRHVKLDCLDPLGLSITKGAEILGVTRLTLSNLVNSRFKHRGLKRLFERGDRAKVPSQDVDRIERILARLNRSSEPEDMDVPGFRLHLLKGRLKGVWSVTVRANWRVTFRLRDGDAYDVDLIDYH